MNFLFNLLTYLVDLNHKKKIIDFFKKKLNNKPIKIIDVGAHKGETINLFSKNLNLKSIVCYEASQKNFMYLKSFEKKN